MKNMLSDHLCGGSCFSSMYEGMQITSMLSKKNYGEDVDGFDALLISFLSHLLPKITLRPLRRFLSQHNFSFSLQDNLSCLRRKLKAFIKTLKKGKSCATEHKLEAVQSRLTKQKEKEEQRESRRLQIHESWPQIISQDLKKKIIETFCEETSSNTLSTFTCAVCGEATLNSNQCKVPIGVIDLEILKWKKLLATRRTSFSHLYLSTMVL